MTRFARWLAGRLIPNAEAVRDPAVRSAFGLLEGWASVAVNLVLAAVKVWLGLAVQSAGLIADGVDSLSDMVTSAVLIFSFRSARKPPDPEHPFGHAKAEHVATLIIAVLVIVVGFEIGSRNVEALLGPAVAPLAPVGWAVFAAILLTMLVKEALAQFSAALGELIGSAALKADSWHHRSDALSTSMVLAGLVARNFGVTWLDPVAGSVVALFIIGTGVRLARESVSPLLGETASAEEIEKMKALTRAVEGVVNVHDLSVHKYGHFYFTAAHVELSDRLDPHKMHEISTVIELRILRLFPGQCVVHVDPIDLFHPLFHEVTDALRQVVIHEPRLVEFRDLNLWPGESGERGDVEVTVDPATPPASHPALAELVQRELRRRFPALELRVRLKVDFTATPLAR